MSNQEKIINILKKVKPTKELESKVDIVEGGYIDSFELMMLISLLSEEFGIEIGIDDMTPDNFNSVESISKMVSKHLDA